MSNEQKITADIKVPNRDLENLKIHFPHYFDKDGNFQLEKFKNNLTEKEINFSTESYGLEWLGKSYARLLASDPATTLLKADETHNAKPENAKAENLLIKGDNLEVLKHLANAYYEQVKMIYIDPPYNTGSDGFVYQDDRKFTVKELKNLIGVDEEKAKRILDFTKQKSNSHSAWLTFLYPRLYIAKQLLKDDGVIFISIDDNEVAQLRLLMDEVFGEDNFVGDIIWEKRYGRSNDAKLMASSVDHIVLYRKSVYLEVLREKRTESADKAYSNPDNDPRGYWTSVSFVSQRTKDERPNLSYKIINPNTKIEFEHPTHSWKYAEDKYEEWLADNRFYWGKDGKQSFPRIKRFLSELDEGLVPINLWKYQETGTGDEGTKEVNELLGQSVFVYPKPTKLIKRAIGLGLKNVLDSSDIILDFFAGSGTTGDAVMQLNAEDGGNRRFILVQLPEEIDKKKNKAAYDFVESLVFSVESLVDDEQLKTQHSTLKTNIFESLVFSVESLVDDEQLKTKNSTLKTQHPTLNTKNSTLKTQHPTLKTQPPTLNTKNSTLKTNITIFEITKERLLRAAKKINAGLDEKTNNLKLKIKNLETELQTEETKQEIENLKAEIIKNSKLKTKNCFRIFETTPIWEDYDFEAEQFDPSQSLFDTDKLTEDDLKSLLVTWKTYDGIALTQDLESVDLSGYTAYYGSGRLYLMHKGFTTDSLKALLEKIDADKHFEPRSIIAFGYHFESARLREISENVKTYNNKKKSDIDFITRY